MTRRYMTTEFWLTAAVLGFLYKNLIYSQFVLAAIFVVNSYTVSRSFSKCGKTLGERAWSTTEFWAYLGLQYLVYSAHLSWYLMPINHAIYLLSRGKTKSSSRFFSPI